MNDFMNIDELSQYLRIKKSTLYSKISEIPHYKLQHLIRFRRDEIDTWLLTFKKEPTDITRHARSIIKESKPIDLNKIINKAIEATKGAV